MCKIIISLNQSTNKSDFNSIISNIKWDFINLLNSNSNLKTVIQESDIKRAKYSELFFCEEETADRCFKSKVYFVILDEKTGKEKKAPNNFLVQAANLKDAVKKLEDGLKNTMMDYVISSIAETAIMDVYPYKVKSEKPEFQDALEQK